MTWLPTLGVVLHEPAPEGGLQDADGVGRQPEVGGTSPAAGVPGITVH